MATSLTVVIPIHDEAGFLPEAVPRLLDELDGVDADWRVVLVENGSSDDTPRLSDEIARDHDRVAAMHLPVPDYGAAMRAGFLDAGGEWVANMDIDYFSGGFLRRALSLGDDADVILASKRAAGAEDRRGAFRRIATRAFNLLLKLLLGAEVSDTHGMKLIRRSVIEDIGPLVISTQDLFDTELVVRAQRAGYRIREIPAVVEELRATRSSLLGRVPRTVRGLLRIRRDLRRGPATHDPPGSE